MILRVFSILKDSTTPGFCNFKDAAPLIGVKTQLFLSMTQEILNLSETGAQLKHIFGLVGGLRGCSVCFLFSVYFLFVLCVFSVCFLCVFRLFSITHFLCAADTMHRRAQNTSQGWMCSACQVSLWKCAFLGVFSPDWSRCSWARRRAAGHRIPSREQLENPGASLLSILPGLGYSCLVMGSVHVASFRPIWTWFFLHIKPTYFCRICCLKGLRRKALPVYL